MEFLSLMLLSSLQVSRCSQTCPSNIQYLVQAGGGGGGNSCGGGGGGGLLTGSLSFSNYNMYTQWAITVGAGGQGNSLASGQLTNGQGNAGGDSTLNIDYAFYGYV